jgi:phosphatidylglycerophosphatase A
MMKQVSVVDRISALLANMFGVGYAPLMPGTAGCIVAIPIFVLVKNPYIFLAITIIATITAFAVSGRAEKVFGQKDSKKIVIDDFAGQLITYLFIPQDIRYIVCGFFLFRMLDVLKIPPADKIEKYKGAKGVVGDDVVAGLYSLAILQIVRLALNIFS